MVVVTHDGNLDEELVDPQARYQHTERRINYPATDGIRTTAKQHPKGV